MNTKLMKISLLWAFIFALTTAYAQLPQGDFGDRREQLEAMQVAYLTQRLSLTPEESQQFWPLYREYKEAEKTLRAKRRQGRKSMELMSDKELEAHMETQFKTEQDLLNLKRDYNTKFKKVLPLRKVAVLPQAEHDFKRELLQRVRDKRDKGPHKGGGPRHR